MPLFAFVFEITCDECEFWPASSHHYQKYTYLLTSCLRCEFGTGSGSILAMVQTASQRTPDVICGKPHRPMFDVLVNKYNIDPKKTLMIGDRSVVTSLATYCCSNISTFCCVISHILY